MREIGVRELKASLSEVLRLAARGERIRVTLHGRPMADIVAPAATTGEDRLHELLSQGRLAAPTRPRPHRAPRLLHPSRSASALVVEERQAER